MATRHLSIVLEQDPQTVYDFAADPVNLPKWAAGLAQSETHQVGQELFVESPMGRVKVTFVDRNSLGVLDHTVVLPTGESVYNPLRVLAHPEGSEVVFTLRQLSMSNEEFDRDTQLVETDLQRLRDCFA